MCIWEKILGGECVQFILNNIWMIILILFLIVEISTTALVSIWFCIGAIAAWIGDMLNLSFNAQLIIFVVVSLVSLICTRPLFKKLMKPSKDVRTNVDSLINKEAVVTQRIDNLHGNGEVKINGQFWTARSSDGSIIGENSIVVIEKIEGVKLLVKMKGE